MSRRLIWPVPKPQCANLLRLIAEPTRLGVIQRLLLGPHHVGELNSSVGVEQSLLSHHLRVLREAGLVEAMRDGRSVLYRLSPRVQPHDHDQAIDLGCCRLVFASPRTADRKAKS